MTKLTISSVSDHTYDVSLQLTESGGFHFNRGHHTVNVNVHELPASASPSDAPHGHVSFDLTFSCVGLLAADLLYATWRHAESPQPVTPFNINGPNHSLRVFARPHSADHCIVRISLDHAEETGHHNKHHGHH